MYTNNHLYYTKNTITLIFQALNQHNFLIHNTH